LIKESQIVLKRMRPLLSLPRDMRFVINGHYMYDMGASDNPQIGTIEDWYMINTLFEPHPIHIHLINFQVVKQYSLKMVQDDCTLYEIDYLRNSKYKPFNGLNDTQMCNYISQITSNDADALFHHLNSLNLENLTQNTMKSGKISGFNVL
jgi:hypothetical protein